MCPNEPAPPPYIVAQIEPGRAVVMGHQEDGRWVDLWQFVILPGSDGTSRLLLRTRTIMTGGFWTIIHPGVFIMERGMLLGIKQRAEALSPGDFAEVAPPYSPTPTPSGSDLPLTCQVTDLNVYIERAAGYCFAYPERFTLGEQPSDQPPVLGPALGSPVEPVHATFVVEVVPSDDSKTLEQQAAEYLKGFTVVDPASLIWQQVLVGGEAGIMVEPVPVQLSWRIVFVRHAGSLYRLKIWPVDLPNAKADVDELSQVALNSFAFLDE